MAEEIKVRFSGEDDLSQAAKEAAKGAELLENELMRLAKQDYNNRITEGAKVKYAAMSEGQKLATLATAQFRDKQEEAAKAAKKLAAEQEKLSQGHKNLAISLTALNQGWEVAQKAVQLLGQGYDFLVGNTVEYANTVRQLSRITGTSSDETSRIIQLTDDYNVSLQSLEQAARGAATKGIVLTTASLARMSDEYLRLATQEERNTFLLDNFGRSGLEMAKVMEAGGEAIRKQSAAIADNLVLTDAQVKKARELEIAEDNLNDTLAGLGNTLGNSVIPGLVSAAGAFDNIINAADKFNAVFQAHNQALMDSSVSYETYAAETQRANNRINVMNGLLAAIPGFTRQSIPPIKKLTEAEREAAMAGEEWSSGTREAAVAAGVAGRASIKYASSAHEMALATKYSTDAIVRNKAAMEALAELEKMEADAKRDIAAATQAAATAQENFNASYGAKAAASLSKYAGEGKKYREGLAIQDMVLGTQTAAAYDAERAMDKLSQQFASGQIDAATYKAGLEGLKPSFESFDQNLIKSKENLENVRKEWYNLIANFQSANGMTIHIKTVIDAAGGMNSNSNTGGKAGADDDIAESLRGKRAGGGNVYAGRPYTVGELGPEPFIPSRNGYVLSHSDAMSAVRQAAGGSGSATGGVTYIINGGLHLHGVQNVDQMNRELGKMQSKAKRSGSGRYAGRTN